MRFPNVAHITENGYAKLALITKGHLVFAGVHSRLHYSARTQEVKIISSFRPLKGRFHKLKDGSVVAMLEYPSGVLVQYPDGTKRFISDSYYEPSHDEFIDWSDEMAEHLTIIYADKHYLIFRREIRMSGTVIPLDSIMDLESVPYPQNWLENLRKHEEITDTSFAL